MLDWLEIGRVVGAQGLKGEVRVYPDSDFPERFLQPGQRWVLRPGESEPQPIKLLQGRYLGGKGLYVLTFAGVQTREQADDLRGCRLFVPASDRPPLEEDEFHVMDLIGLKVFNQVTQAFIGTVTDVIPAGNDLLEVELDPVASEEGATPAESVETLNHSEPDHLELDHPELEKGAEVVDPPKKPKKVLIPFVKAIVPIVDLQAGQVEIDPPVGLIE